MQSFIPDTDGRRDELPATVSRCGGGGMQSFMPSLGCYSFHSHMINSTLIFLVHLFSANDLQGCYVAPSSSPPFHESPVQSTLPEAMTHSLTPPCTYHQPYNVQSNDICYDAVGSLSLNPVQCHLELPPPKAHGQPGNCEMLPYQLRYYDSPISGTNWSSFYDGSEATYHNMPAYQLNLASDMVRSSLVKYFFFCM